MTSVDGGRTCGACDEDPERVVAMETVTEEEKPRDHKDMAHLCSLGCHRGRTSE